MPLVTGRERRRQLLDAAIWTFARKGFRRASISDIVARAQVARGTFYLYFDSKEDVFLAIVEDFHDRVRRMLEEPEPPVPLADHHGRALLQRTLRRWLELFAGHRDAAQVILKEATSIDPKVEAGLRRLRQLGLNYFATRFERLQARGLVNRGVSPDLLAHLQMGMMDEAVIGFILPEPRGDVDALAAQIASFEWDGLRPDRSGTPAVPRNV
ncbi:MAG TPA: TetR/AcrR family transcriptional regulator [Vicinamibacterales bacterium]|nr:TetR/AcrR family transcriptional regulator [Vicinamibacterales bacterium]